MPGPDAIIIDAGPAGLAAAHELNARGLETVILEKEGCVGAVWRRHYDRLHLHTPRSTSSLPGLKMPTAFGRYPSRSQFVEYLESYAAKFALKPRFGAAVKAVRRDGGGWLAEAGAHSTTATIIVVATGWADFPYLRPGRGWTPSKGRSSTRARIAIPIRSPASGHSLSDSAIPALRSRLTSARRPSRSL